MLVICTFAFVSFGEDKAQETKVQRGKYLVEQVGMCADCHTPRDQKGEFLKQNWLQGSAIHFTPVHPMPFAAVAPAIAGLPTYATDDQAIKFLEAGITASGKPALPPMPQYRFNHEDATAVVAYLRSLKKT